MLAGTGLNGAPSVMPVVADTFPEEAAPPASWACSLPSSAPSAAPVDAPLSESVASAGTRHIAAPVVDDSTASSEMRVAKPSSKVSSGLEAKQTDKQHQGKTQAKKDQVEDWQRLLAESWSKAKAVKRSEQGKQQAQVETGESLEQAKSTKKGFFQWARGSADKEKAAAEKYDGNEPIGDTSQARQRLPETFEEMMMFNCKIMGANIAWIRIATEKLDSLVSSVVSGRDAYLEQETSFLALRFHKEAKGKIDLKQFRVCLLASMRSVLGDDWSLGHESAWGRMWNLVEEKLNGSLALPATYEKPVLQLFETMSREDKRRMGMSVFIRLFKKIPDTENYFKQNNERLIFIVTRALEMSGEMYAEPARVIADTMQLGLRHIMYNVPSQYFEPFVLCCVEELEAYTTDPLAVEGVAWTLTHIAALIVRIIEETATPLIRAVLANSPKQVKKALGEYSRQDRAASAI